MEALPVFHAWDIQRGGQFGGTIIKIVHVSCMVMPAIMLTHIIYNPQLYFLQDLTKIKLINWKL